MSAGDAHGVFDRHSRRQHSGRQHLRAILWRRRTADRAYHDNHVRPEQSASHGRATDNGHATENAEERPSGRKYTCATTIRHLRYSTIVRVNVLFAIFPPRVVTAHGPRPDVANTPQNHPVFQPRNLPPFARTHTRWFFTFFFLWFINSTG